MDARSRIERYITAQARPVDKHSHQPRLYAVARRIAEELDYDDDVLHAAAWLHDLGVFIGHRPEDPDALACWDNVAYAAAKVPALLREFGFPEAKIDAVVQAIQTHLPSGQPASREATLLRDADLLEQLGAVGILRMVSKVGRDTRYPTFAEALAVLRTAALTLPSKLQLPAGRRMAEEKLRLLEAFLAAAEREACGGPL